MLGGTPFVPHIEETVVSILVLILLVFLPQFWNTDTVQTNVWGISHSPFQLFMVFSNWRHTQSKGRHKAGDLIGLNFVFFLLFYFLGSSEACSNFQCPTGGYCVETASGQPSCHCPLCGGEWDPVCGTDGVTYTNPCRLRYESCRHNKSLSIVYKGLCSKSIYSICLVKMLLLN